MNGKKPNRNLSTLIIVVLLIAAGSLAGLAYCGDALKAVKSAEPYPAESLLQSVKGMLQTAAPAESIQAEIAAGVNPAIISFLVMDQGGIVVAGYPADTVGKNLGVYVIHRTVNMMPLPMSPRLQSEESPSFPSVVFQGRDPDEGSLQLHYEYVTTPDNQSYLIASVWTNRQIFEATKGLRAALNAFDGLFRLSFILYWLLLAYWVYRDAKAKGANGPAWGILTLFTNVIGWSVYLVARPKMAECPACHRCHDAACRFCPDCGCRLQVVCPKCNARVEESWRYCAACGAELRGKGLVGRQKAGKACAFPAFWTRKNAVEEAQELMLFDRC